ncbi:cysteine hydrolase [Rubellimicrobium rubrum]|uniref:Cysteine hydrolase n=1 Tax=Rubellimicrobium rubrum TaxID=2585369 RepID=A0A5C4ML79_9RHOB|nr:cysteine hydrolase [Rubellimicrobium rubrum]TNC43129.1 cysteine hydrolase [Rubellimicrobium rubrum]
MKSAQGLLIPTRIEELCDPSRMALLVYDMQAGITSQVQDGGRITERAGRALGVARAVGMRVAFTRHLSMPKSWMGVTQYRTAMAWQRTDDPDSVSPWFLRETPGFSIVPELAPTPEETVFDKLAMSAFEGTPLSYALRDCGITAVAIVGIALEIGIEPTCRHATDLGFIPVVLADACGAGHPEAGERTLEAMRFIGEAVISDVDSFARLFERPKV